MRNDRYILPIITFCIVLFNLTKILQVFSIYFYLSTTIISVIPTILILFLTFRFVQIDKSGLTRAQRHINTYVAFFLFFSLLSIILYFQPGNPASVMAYSYGVFYGVIPGFYFFAVRRLSNTDKYKLIHRIVFLNLIMIVFGIVVYVLRPGFYTDYLQGESTRNSLELWQVYGRLQSYFGSTAVGTMGLITLVFIPRLRLAFIIRIALYSIVLLGIILTQQRSAIIIMVFLVMYFIFQSIKNKINAIFFVIVLPFVVYFVGNYIITQMSVKQGVDIVDYTYQNRIKDMNIVEMFEARSGYNKGMSFFYRYPFGLGVGATMNGSENAGYHTGGQVVDANYMRILSDLGIIGLFSFLLIIFHSLNQSYKEDREIFLIILIYALQALGTNIFETFYSVHLFWIFLGIYGNRNVYQGTKLLAG